MNPDTKAELVDALGTGVTSVLKELFVRRREMERLEKEKDMQVELARARNGGSDSLSAPSGRGGVVQTLDRAEELAEEYNDLLKQAEEMESCRLCKSLIRGARDQPVSAQQELLPALQQFFGDIEEDTPTDEVAQRMQQHDRLMELVQQQVGV